MIGNNLSKEFKIKKLGDLVNIKTGKLDANASSENGEYPFFTCSITPLRIDKYSYDCECVLIAGNGDLNVKYYNGKFDAYQRTYIVESKDKLYLDTKYLYYYMSKYIEILRNESIGGVIKYIKVGNLTEAKIPVPKLETQKIIVEILEKSENVLGKRKEAIDLLDELIKSRFIEMFGEGQYPLVKTEDVCEYITKGTTPKSNEIIEQYEEGLIPYLKVYNLSFDGSMLFDDKPQYVTMETHNNFLARSKVFPNDVLMNIVGPPLGKFAIVPHTFIEWNINQAMAIFRATDKINPIYLLHSLKQPRVLRPFIDLAVGVRQQNLSLLQCRNLEIPLPPIEIQNQFSDLVNEVDKLKFEMENSLKEMENNFNSLMQKAFNGELFN